MREPWSPHYPAADHLLHGRYMDFRGDTVDLAVAVFAGQREGKEVVSYGTGVLREGDRWVRVADLPPIDGGAALRMIAPGTAESAVERVAVTWYALAGTVTGNPTIVKLATLRTHLLGGPPGAVAVHLSAEALPGREPVAAIERFRAALGPIDEVADRIAR